MTNDLDVTTLTADVVAAYVRANSVPAQELSELIGKVHKSLVAAAAMQFDDTPEVPAKPAVPIRKSIQEDAIICLECGVGYKSLKRHLRGHHNCTDHEYRTKWNLPHDYPMVAPSYSKRRSKMAKESGLGRSK